MLSGSNLVMVLSRSLTLKLTNQHPNFVLYARHFFSLSASLTSLLHHIYLSSSSLLLSSSPTSTPPSSSSSTSPCILCQPAHLVLGELHHLRLPPLLVLLPVLLVHHHLELEISGELLNLSLKKLCTERSYASSHTNLRCRFRTLFFFKTWIVLVKGNDNYWNQQI